jgi:hypothetical protein
MPLQRSSGFPPRACGTDLQEWADVARLRPISAEIESGSVVRIGRSGSKTPFPG